MSQIERGLLYLALGPRAPPEYHLQGFTQLAHTSLTPSVAHTSQPPSTSPQTRTPPCASPRHRREATDVPPPTPTALHNGGHRVRKAKRAPFAPHRRWLVPHANLSRYHSSPHPSLLPHTKTCRLSRPPPNSARCSFLTHTCPALPRYILTQGPVQRTQRPQRPQVPCLASPWQPHRHTISREATAVPEIDVQTCRPWTPPLPRSQDQARLPKDGRTSHGRKLHTAGTACTQCEN